MRLSYRQYTHPDTLCAVLCILLIAAYLREGLVDMLLTPCRLNSTPQSGMLSLVRLPPLLDTDQSQHIIGISATAKSNSRHFAVSLAQLALLASNAVLRRWKPA